MAYAWVLAVHRHSRALMCLWVALLGCVGRMLQWRATHTGTTVREWVDIGWVLDCRVLIGWPGGHPHPLWVGSLPLPRTPIGNPST